MWATRAIYAFDPQLLGEIGLVVIPFVGGAFSAVAAYFSTWGLASCIHRVVRATWPSRKIGLRSIFRVLLSVSLAIGLLWIYWRIGKLQYIQMFEAYESHRDTLVDHWITWSIPLAVIANVIAFWVGVVGAVFSPIDRDLWEI